MSFETLGLSAELLRAISDQGYNEPTPIQAQAIPLVLAGKDLMAGAQTGTGKTAGFTLPLLQRLSAAQPDNRKRRTVRALVLAPTRELAIQVGESVALYGKHLPFRSTVVFGGVNIKRQIDRLNRGVDVLVATPGRLLDLVQRKAVDLSQVETIVLDEADRMLDMGFIHDIRRVMKLVPQKEDRQTLLFSATFSKEIRQLSHQFLESPEQVQVTPSNSAVELIEQKIYPVDKARKRELLSQLIGTGWWKQVLVFTRTKHGANRLARQLESDGLSATAIHGNKSQGARTRAMQDFKSGQVRVLVATDIAARGLDIDQLPHVVNYELPNVPEDYVHRIGRTGRAGNEGTAISLVCPDEFKLLNDIERLLKRELPRENLAGYEVTTEASQAGARQNHRRARSGNARGRNSNGRPQNGRQQNGKHHNGNGSKSAAAGRRRAKSSSNNKPASKPAPGYSTVAERLF